jgi:hypothetical protein
LVEPLYRRMAELVRKSHVVATDDTILPMLSPGKTKRARMWFYVGDPDHPYNVFDFTLDRGRDIATLAPTPQDVVRSPLTIFLDRPFQFFDAG